MVYGTLKVSMEKKQSPINRSFWLSLITGCLMLALVASLPTETLAASSKAVPDISSFEKPEASSGFSRGLQGILGLNLMAKWIGNALLEKELRKSLEGGSLSAKLKPYSAGDLAQGKARHLEITGRDLLYDQSAYITYIHVETDETTPIWINLRNGKLKSPIKARVDLVVSEADMNRSFTTPKLGRKLKAIKVPLLGVASQTLSLEQAKINLKPSELGFSGFLRAAGAPLGINLNLLTDLRVVEPERTRLAFKNLKIQPIPGVSNITIVENVMSKVLERFLNPSLMVPLDKATLKVDTLLISESKIHLTGEVTALPSDPEINTND